MDANKHFLFVTMDGGGNIPPVFGLAKRLKARGHRITFLTEPCLKAPVLDMGMEFTPFEEYFTRTDRNEDFFQDVGPRATKTAALDRVVFGPARSVTHQTLDTIKNMDPDVLVVDCLMPGAIIAGEVERIPVAVVFHFPEYFPGPNRPPGIMGLIPGKGPLGKFRDRLLGAVFHKVLNRYLPSLNELYTEYNLKPLERTADIMSRPALRLMTTLRSFDFPVIPAPDNIRYSGPVLDDPDWVEPWTDPWDPEDARPLVVVSLSSTFMDQKNVLQRIISALGRLEIRALVTLGPVLNPNDFSPATNTRLVRSAPHSVIFPVADLVITHAGHGTIMRALSHGIPLLCMPLGRDQLDNAAKVSYHGCGIRLSSKSGENRIQRAVMSLLTDRYYRHNAENFAEEIKIAETKDLAIQSLVALTENKKLPV